MSFFGLFNYNKPGPGVSKDYYEPPMKVFFSVFFRKFWKMVMLNLMYFVCTIPLWVILFVPTMTGFDENQVLMQYNSQILVFLLISVVGLPFFNTGFAFILRNFSRENHAWLWHDFVDKVKANFKQAFALFIIDAFVVFTAIVNINFYAQVDTSGNMMLLFAKSIALVAYTIYFMMHYFIYTIMVTFDLKLKHILKNALIMTFVKLPRNVGITALLYIIGALVFGVGAPIGIILSLFIMCIFVNYIVTFNAVSLVDKYLMPFDDDEDTEEESCFSDDRTVTAKNDE